MGGCGARGEGIASEKKITKKTHRMQMGVVLVLAVLAHASTASSFVLPISVGRQCGQQIVRRCPPLPALRTPAVCASNRMLAEAEPRAGGSRRAVLEHLLAAVGLATFPTVAAADSCSRKDCQVFYFMRRLS